MSPSAPRIKPMLLNMAYKPSTMWPMSLSGQFPGLLFLQQALSMTMSKYGLSV